jgi:integrase
MGREQSGEPHSLVQERLTDQVHSAGRMPKLLASLALEAIPVQTFSLTCLLTGCRGGEARAMKCQDLNLLEGLWSKPTTKTGPLYQVPLPPPSWECWPRSRVRRNGSLALPDERTGRSRKAPAFTIGGGFVREWASTM